MRRVPSTGADAGLVSPGRLASIRRYALAGRCCLPCMRLDHMLAAGALVRRCLLAAVGRGGRTRVRRQQR